MGGGWPSSTASCLRHREIASVPNSAVITAVKAFMSSAEDAFLRRTLLRTAHSGGAEVGSVWMVTTVITPPGHASQEGEGGSFQGQYYADSEHLALTLAFIYLRVRRGDEQYVAAVRHV